MGWDGKYIKCMIILSGKSKVKFSFFSYFVYSYTVSFFTNLISILIIITWLG